MKLKYNELIFDINGDVNLDNYYTKSECDNKYALKSHSHSISNITNLQSQLNSKAASNHTHSQYATTTAVTNAQNTANNALNVANSKTSFGKSTSKIVFNGTSMKLTKNGIICTAADRSSMWFLDGLDLQYLVFDYYHSGSERTYYWSSGLATANSTLSYKWSSLSNRIVGFYS